mmetsp:Transcript_3898/g.10205  ORF Transcript_3898/g.10205 Transcript_3898/m.10205 type:complete len:258 (-) Transcript_3898:215-988(-)
MSSEHYGKYDKQNFNLQTFSSSAEERQQYQRRNSMKRPRDDSPPASDHANNPSYCNHIRKRLRPSSCTNFLGTTNCIPNDSNHHSGIFLTNKSDDDISLAEEAQITPTSLPQHSSFIQQKQNQCRHIPDQIPQQQHQIERGVSEVTATDVLSKNSFSGANLTTYATDYQPMNSFLGNLHLMRQQQQLRRQTDSYKLQGEEQIRDHPGIVRTQQPQQQPQNHYHRHHGNYHSVPTRNLNTKTYGGKKIVSLRVNSNLY